MESRMKSMWHQRFPLPSLCTISKLHGFLTKLPPFPSPSTKSMHSLCQLNQKKKPITPFHTENHNKKKHNVSSSGPTEYMRNIIWKIYKTLKFSNWDSAQQELEKFQLRWDSYTVNQVLKSHPPLEKAWLFFNWASRVRGFKHDQFTYTTMLDIFGEAGRIDSMKHVFQEMVEKGIKVDTVTYTSMMHWLSSYGNFDEALKVWEEMKCKGIYPGVVSYTAFMKILFDHGRVKEATNVYKEMIQNGCVPNCYTYTILMEYLIGSGKSKDAHEIFEKMQEAGVQPDKAACNILIERCSKVGETVFMIQILQYMKENRLVLRYPVYVGALEALKNAGESETLLRQVNPQFYMDSGIRNEAHYCNKTSADSPVVIDIELLSDLIKKRNMVAIDHLLAGMIHKKIPLDHKVISTIIEVNCDRPHGALLAFKYSVKMGISIDRTGYLALIGLLTRSNMLSKLVEIVEQMTRAGHSLGIYLASLLINRLGCAKKPNFATKIFNLLPENQKCTATYTALISTYFSARKVNQALEIYNTMCRKGCCPVLGTYNVLIAGLERNGRHSAAEFYRKAKKSVHANSSSQESVWIEEKICNLLFAVDVVI